MGLAGIMLTFQDGHEFIHVNISNVNMVEKHRAGSRLRRPHGLQIPGDLSDEQFRVELVS